MAKDPAVLLYTSDFLTGTMMLSDEQVGKYIRLLCLQHQKGFLTEKDMLKICGSRDEEIFGKFDQVEGNFTNKRMKEEAEKRKSYSESRAKNRKKKEEENNICKTYEKDMNNISNTYEEHMENENENEIINIIKEEKEHQILEMKEEHAEVEEYPTFEDFWDEYDKKVGEKGKIKKKWVVLSLKEREAIMDYIPNYKAAQPDKQYRKNPETFLNNKSWNDELIFENGKQKQTTSNDRKQKWANHFAKGTSPGT
jgi:hypothetical protein